MVTLLSADSLSRIHLLSAILGYGTTGIIAIWTICAGKLLLSCLYQITKIYPVEFFFK